MDIKNIFILIVGLLNILLGLFVYFKNRQHRANFWFFMMCLFGGGWAVVKSFQLTVIDIFWQDQFFVKLVYILGIIAPLSYLMLAYNFPYRIKIYTRKFIYFIYTLPLILSILTVLGILKKHNSFVIDGELVREVNIFDFSIFGTYFFLYVFAGLVILLKKYRKAEGIHRIQIKYLLLATMGTFITTGFLSVILPWFNIFTYDWLGAIFLLIHFCFIGYWLFIKK